MVIQSNAMILQVKKLRGLPWWSSGKESAFQCRGHGFNPWSGEIPHATEQQSPCATTTEPALQNLQVTTTEPAHPRDLMPQILSPCAATTEACELQGPRATTTEAACLEPVLHNKRSHHNEKPKHCNEEQLPLAATRESPCTATKTQQSQKKKKNRNHTKNYV